MLIVARQRVCTAYDAEIGLLLRFAVNLERAHFTEQEASKQNRAL